MANVRVNGLTKAYGDLKAVNDVSFEVEEGELVSLLGPSGCGKTTTLRTIAGFVRPDEGQVLIGGRDVTDSPSYRRDTSMVFQSYALFPHLTAFDNVAFGLRMRRVPSTDLRRRVDEVLSLVGMAKMRGRYPAQLSGGQQQRIALARALVVHPSVLLLDEPLSNLDAKLREQMRVEIKELQQRLHLTAVFVTHDQEEALSISDKLVVMRGGEVLQVGPPAEIFHAPKTRFVADFIGAANIIDGSWEERGVLRSQGGLVLRTDTSRQVQIGSQGVVAVRPQVITLSEVESNLDANKASGTVEFISYRGSEFEYRVRLSTGEVFKVRAPSADGSKRHGIGAEVTLTWSVRHSIVVDPDQGTD